MIDRFDNMKANYIKNYSLLGWLAEKKALPWLATVRLPAPFQLQCKSTINVYACPSFLAFVLASQVLPMMAALHSDNTKFRIEYVSHNLFMKSKLRVYSGLGVISKICCTSLDPLSLPSYINWMCGKNWSVRHLI